MITCVGLATLDVVNRVAEVPARNQKVVATGLRIDVGGPAANAARIARHLGSRVRLVTALGNSPMADWARARLAGIEIVDVAPPDHQIPVSTVLLTPDGARTVVSRNATALPPGIEVDPSWGADSSVMLHDGHLLPVSVPLAQAHRNVTHVLDGGSWKPGLEDLLGLLDVAVVSADFALPDQSPDQSLDGLAGLGIRHLAQSHGAEAVEVRQPQGVSLIEAPEVEVVDTLGAGDVLHGALVAGLDAGRDFLGALTEAVRIASESVTHEGILPGA